MAKAVENASIVCCFITPDYESSRNCKLELEHAQRRGKRIIACMVSNRKVWKPSPDAWLAFITGSLIAMDFSDTSEESIDKKVDNLIALIQKQPSDPPLPSVSKPNDF